MATDTVTKVIWPPETGKMRAFESGATRDSGEGKLEYEACLSPIATERYAEYMLKCSICSDGSKRPGDNWQKGITLQSYMESIMRHVWDVWKLHRGFSAKDRKTGKPVTMEEALCATWFNVQGYLHEILKQKEHNGTD
jgi:hypothetical protein